MKTFLNWLKDFIYDSIDYIIMLVIIVSVVFVIGWRLDVLFANDATDIPHKNTIISNEDEKPKDSNVDKQEPLETEDVVESPEIQPTDDVEEPSDTQIPESPVVENNPSSTDKVSISITIPPGSLPSKIGDILESNGLISSKKDFVIKAQELKLDTKLKSGNFKISKNLSIEEVLKIITK